MPEGAELALLASRLSGATSQIMLDGSNTWEASDPLSLGEVIVEIQQKYLQRKLGTGDGFLVTHRRLQAALYIAVLNDSICPASP